MALDSRPRLGGIFRALGVSATVTPPGESAIDTTIIWLTSAMENGSGMVDMPGAAEFHRIERMHVLEMRKDEVPTAPRGTQVVAPEIKGGEDQTRIVESTVREDAECRRVIVIRDPDA